MLTWSEKEAPVRGKFKVLLGVNTTLAGVGLATTVLAGGSPLLLGAAGAALVATIGAGIAFSSQIRKAYADIAEQAQAQIHVAAATQNDTGRVAEAQLVTALSSGLKKLSNNQLDFQLNDPLPAAYEDLRKDFNAAVSSLGTTMRSVRSSAVSVHNGATEIRSASDDLAQRNERQAANLEEAASAMNQVTDNIRLTAERATLVQRTIAATHQEATEGGKVVTQATSAMGAIEKSAQEIGQIISVIDSIAFQTNLLALNAGVEAARAGDAGKGFAVVANEVRALAQRSADAAKDIKELITASSRQVGEGVTLVAETGALLEKILSGVGDITGLMTEIAETATAQSSNLQQINSTVGEMDRMTQQNAAMVEQSTAAARSLADEANELTSLVSRFAAGDDGVVIPRHAPTPRTVRAAPAIMSAPPVHGNLAMKPAPVEDFSADDWAEF